jgi:hypothetical protein
MALRSTQPLTEMSTKNLPGGKGLPTRKADNLTAICEHVAALWRTDHSFEESYRLCKKEYDTEEETRAQQVL